MRRLSLLLLLLCCVAASVTADDELSRLREDYARRYFGVDTHLALAKHLESRGDQLTAFYICEAARRDRSGDEVFDPAFRRIFGGDLFDNSAAAEKRLRAEVEASPDDAAKRIALADVYLSRSEWKRAEKELKQALALAPDSFDAVALLAEVLRRDGRKTEGEALEAKWLAGHAQSVEALRHRAQALSGENDDAARKLLKEAVLQHPNDAQLHFMNGSMLQRAGDLVAAEKELTLAAELDPKSAMILGWTGRFELKLMKNPAKALPYYLDAYFLDPHFYETEYAEGRIRTIAYELAAGSVSAADSLLPLFRDRNPVVAGLAIARADEAWDAAYVEPLVALLASDDETVRARSAETLSNHVDATFDARLRELLRSSDLRVRGSAAYIAGARWKEEVVPILAPWLDEPADLIRYDAISVLATSGGDRGRALLRKARAEGKFTHERLKEMVDSLDQKR